MHRFFIEPKTLGYEPNIYNRWNDTRWRALVDEFRWDIRLRYWKIIDRRFRLMVKVENWDGQEVLLIANGPEDAFLVDAYIKAGFMEGRAIIVFADTSIPWKLLREFKAVNPRRSTRRKRRGRRAIEGTATGSAHESATEECLTRATSLANETGRSGDPDIVAGDCLIRPKQHEADCRGKDPDSQRSTLTGRGPSGAGHRSVAV